MRWRHGQKATSVLNVSALIAKKELWLEVDLESKSAELASTDLI